MTVSTVTQLGDPVLVNPQTGEALDLTAPTEDLASWFAAVRELELQIRERKQRVTSELLRRMDRGAAWTVRVGQFKLTAPSPAPVEEWDGVELRAALLELVDDGTLDIAAVDAAVETVITYKPRKAGITALRKLGGRVAETVNGLAREAEKARYVKVEQR
jgi:hypothetical protein